MDELSLFPGPEDLPAIIMLMLLYLSSLAFQKWRHTYQFDQRDVADYAGAGYLYNPITLVKEHGVLCSRTTYRDFQSGSSN